MIKPDIKIIAVDNEQEELDRILNVFNKLRISCFPIKYNIGDDIEEKFTGIRIAFFDINLAGAHPTGTNLCNIISSALKEVIDINNGPYALIFWSYHTGEIDAIKKHIEEREKDNIPSPVLVDKIDKALIAGDENNLLRELKRILTNSTLEAMFDYQEKAKIAATKTINSIFSLIPRDGDKWGENENFEKNFDLVFSKMAINALGEELGRRNPDLAVQRALSPMLLDNMQKERLSIVWKDKMTSLSDQLDIKFPNTFQIESLNTIYHLDNDISTMKKDDRGIVIKIKQTSTWFKNVFGKKKSDLVESYFTFPNIKGKTADEVKTIRQQFVDSCIPIFVEISAGCDYAQRNSRSLKYLFGIKFPIDLSVAKPSNGNYKIITPFFSLNGEKFSMLFNFRYMYGHQISSNILGDILFKLSDDLINQIGNRYANHVSRIGIISYE